MPPLNFSADPILKLGLSVNEKRSCWGFDATLLCRYNTSTF
jgi:hypothetical protein